MKVKNTHRIRREQICSRCRNHGKFSILRSHKKYCPFINCTCEKCSETRDRQQFIAKEIRFHRKKQKSEESGLEKLVRKIPSPKLMDEETTNNTTSEVRRHQMCARCRNHDEYNPIKGHKNNCAFAHCECEKCQITEERRKIMAKQIRENRSNKIAIDDDDGYSGSPTGSPESENDVFKYPHMPEESLPQLRRIETLEESNNNVMTDEKEMFYIVQSLYEKCFVYGDPKTKFEVLYAFVKLAQGNWSVINQSLSQGSEVSQENVEKHLKMAKFHQYLLSQSTPSWFPSATVTKEATQQQLDYNQPHHQHQQQLWLRAMGGNF